MASMQPSRTLMSELSRKTYRPVLARMPTLLPLVKPKVFFVLERSRTRGNSASTMAMDPSVEALSETHNFDLARL